MKLKKEKCEEIRLLVAMFEGRQISDEEASRIHRQTTTRNRVIRETFALTQQEVETICAYGKEVGKLLGAFCKQKEKEVQQRVREIEAKALQKMRDPNRARQIRALLAPR